MVEHAAFAPVAAEQVNDYVRGGGGCSLDAIDGNTPAIMERSGKPLLHGWLADIAVGIVPPHFEMVLRGQQDFALRAHGGDQPRPDVAKYFDEPGLTQSGYEIIADASGVPPGDYSVVFLYTSEGQPVQCNPQVRITVK